jgi:hypothetical protein
MAQYSNDLKQYFQHLKCQKRGVKQWASCPQIRNPYRPLQFQVPYQGLQNQMMMVMIVCVTTLILNEYRQSSNSSVSSFQVQDSKMTQNAYC